MNIDKTLSEFLAEVGIPVTFAGVLAELIIIMGFILLVVLLNYIGRNFIINLIKKITQRTAFEFDDLLMERNVIKYIIHMVPPLIIYLILPYFFEEGRYLVSLIRKICVVYLLFSFLLALNGLVQVLYDNYNRKRTERQRPIRGFLQVIQIILFCIGFIIIISVIINRSPTALLAGIGASAAIFTLVFKDLITGFIAGVQLSLNDMVRPGDWVTLADGQTDGIVQEITLITVKIKNFDNSISTVPPTVLVTNTFKNWREMLESSGRLVSKSIYVDKTSIKFCSPELMHKLQSQYPILADYEPVVGEQPTNAGMFRIYMEKYLLKGANINPDMGLRVGELESTDRGVPIRLYFFTRDKENRGFDRIQADILDHGMAILPDFELIIK